jgi:division/cell wall cluster transcriptional repressor MraZ
MLTGSAGLAEDKPFTCDYLGETPPGDEPKVFALGVVSLTNKNTRDYVRMVSSGAFQEVPDKQGRITIAPLLREYASLTRDVVVIGSMNRVEIWDPVSWQTYLREQEQRFADLSEEIFPGI